MTYNPTSWQDLAVGEEGENLMLESSPGIDLTSNSSSGGGGGIINGEKRCGAMEAKYVHNQFRICNFQSI